MQTLKHPYRPPYRDEIGEAAGILRNGGLAVFPTETVYGLGADAFSAEAVSRIFAAKGRPPDNPLIVHIDSPAMLEQAASDIPPLAYRLMECFSPGPLSIVLPKHPSIPEIVTGGLGTVALRIPSHPIARALIAASGVPLAAPSANRSGRPSPTTFGMACDEMDGRADIILDGGDCEVGIESTVVTLTGDTAVILRPGAVTAEMIRNRLHIDVTGAAEPSEIPQSPGTKYAHYRPNAAVLLTARMNDGLLYEWMDRYAGKTIGILRLFPEIMREDGGEIRLRLDEIHARELLTGTRVIERAFYSFEEYARELYRTFAEFDRLGADVIIAEAVEETGLGRALADRLRKASGGEWV
jgi:L-threonylcarbamoyladenylate synthase